MSVSFRGTENYVASPELMGAVDIAVALQKPLLIKGEPGTGKTVLAQAVAEALGKKLIIWNVKSTTKAQDGLYVYDVVQRLYDSQFGGQGVDDIKKYIKLGKLGEAFSAEEQVVLLIDEVDKADLEFPNDLLWELDRMEFYIPRDKGDRSRQSSAPSSSSPPTRKRSCPTPSCAAASSTTSPSPRRSRWRRFIRVHFDKLDESAARSRRWQAFYWLRSMRQHREKALHERAGGLAPRARARRRRSRAHRKGHSLRRRAAQKGQGHHGDAAPDAVSPCLSDFSTFCVSAASAFHSTSG